MKRRPSFDLGTARASAELRPSYFSLASSVGECLFEAYKAHVYRTGLLCFEQCDGLRLAVAQSDVNATSTLQRSNIRPVLSRQRARSSPLSYEGDGNNNGRYALSCLSSLAVNLDLIGAIVRLSFPPFSPLLPPLHNFVFLNPNDHRQFRGQTTAAQAKSVPLLLR